jgi:hypothetical protein
LLFGFCLTRRLICCSFNHPLLEYRKFDELDQRGGGAMSMSQLRDSTAIGMILTNGTGADALKLNLGQVETYPSKKSPHDGAPNTATDRVSTYLRGISETSTDEIDALISDLSVLRQRLVADGGKIEQNLTDFATLNQSVLSLTRIVSESVAQVKTMQHH